MRWGGWATLGVEVPEVGLSEATLENTEGDTIISVLAAGVFVAEPGCILSIMKWSRKACFRLVQPVEPIQGRAAEGGREEENGF
ncbi:unnamed protein product [Prunus brigantina]